MPMRKTSLRETQGLNLVQAEDVSIYGTTVRSPHDRLCKSRRNPARAGAGGRDAPDAVDLEVIARGSDREIPKLHNAERR